MTMHTRVSGVWKELTNAHTKVSGAWKEITEGYENVGGTWKQFFVRTFLGAGDGGTVAVTDGSAPYNSTVAIRFNTDGSVETGTSVNGAGITFSPAGSWINPESASAGADCSVRCTNIDDSNGYSWTAPAAAEDTWVTLAASKTWGWNESSSTPLGANSFTCDFEVRDNGGDLDTATVPYTFRINNTL